MTYHAGLGRVVMAGGEYATVPADLVWAWDGSRWSALWTEPVSPPVGPGPMIYGSSRERAVANITTGAGQQTWEWDGQAWELRATGSTVPLGPMAFDTIRAVAVLFSETGETWTWNGQQWVRVPVSGPGARVGGSMAFDSDRGVAVFLGGAGRTDTWEWNGESWTAVIPEGAPPAARVGAAMCYDTNQHRTIMSGGYIGDSVELNDTWSWDGHAWAQLALTPPEPRVDASMTFDSARVRRVLFGGLEYLPRGVWRCFRDTWESGDATGWTLVDTAGPTERSSAFMTYDAARDNIVLFGGSLMCTTDDHTWIRTVRQINGDPSISAQPADAQIALGGGVSFRVEAAGEGTLTYQWRHDGQSIERDFTNRIYGENTAILSIVDAVIQDTGSYDVVVSNACGPVTSEPAMLTITGGCPADFNTDGVANSQDFFDYLNAFFALSPSADFDHSGTIDSSDFFAFLLAFFAGCT